MVKFCQFVVTSLCVQAVCRGGSCGCVLPVFFCKLRVVNFFVVLVVVWCCAISSVKGLPFFMWDLWSETSVFWGVFA